TSKRRLPYWSPSGPAKMLMQAPPRKVAVVIWPSSGTDTSRSREISGMKAPSDDMFTIPSSAASASVRTIPRWRANAGRSLVIEVGTVASLIACRLAIAGQLLDARAAAGERLLEELA